jgi:hypothetical protein
LKKAASFTFPLQFSDPGHIHALHPPRLISSATLNCVTHNAVDGFGKTKTNMKIKHLLAITLALGLTAWSAMAQNDGPPPGQPGPPPGDNGGPPDGPPPGGGQGGRHRRPPPIIEALDANHDGIISADEIANAAKALSALAASNGGQITLENAFGPPPGPPPGGPDGDQPPPPPGGDNGGGKPSGGHRHPPIPPIFAALDTNGDGVLTADEIANAPKSLLKLDKNGDGQLTPDEYRPQRPPPPQRGSDSSN